MGKKWDRPFLTGEDWLQHQICQILEFCGIRFYSIPNGGKRPLLTAKRMKATGQQSGIPDLCLPESFGDFHGLYVEVKMPGNYPSPNQRKWMEILSGLGYRVTIVHSTEEMIDLLRGCYPDKTKKIRGEREWGHQ